MKPITAALAENTLRTTQIHRQQETTIQERLQFTDPQYPRQKANAQISVAIP